MYAIYGKGRVGQAVAKLCEARNIDYRLIDDDDKISDFSEFEAIIPSPGIPGTHPIYVTGKVIAELDFAFQFLPTNFRIFAISGTDGKSTTTFILYSILEKYYFGKRKIFLSGNFEVPFSETVLEILKNNIKEWDIVVEVSSFMAHWIGKSHLKPFSPSYTILTNLKSDHLNWHSNLQEYADAKINLIKNTKKWSIINEQLLDFRKEKNLEIFLPENVIFFGKNKSLDYNTDGEEIFLKNFGKFILSETSFSGSHNAMNLLSVLLVLEKYSLDKKKVRKILPQILGLPHRLEYIGTKKWVKIIEDSKSTSSQSLEAALGSFGQEKNILLIAGGSNKGDNFSHLWGLFHKRVKAVVCIGETKNHFSDIAKKENIPFLETDNLEDWVKWLFARSSDGDVLMLSPGCASFGLFAGYLDRATKFRKIIENI